MVSLSLSPSRTLVGSKGFLVAVASRFARDSVRLAILVKSLSTLGLFVLLALAKLLTAFLAVADLLEAICADCLVKDSIT